MIYRKNDPILKKILNRGSSFEGEYLSTVNEILKNVKERGDEALREYSIKFDNYDTSNGFEVSRDEMEEAYNLLDGNIKTIMTAAKKNIERFHEKQLERSWFVEQEDNVILGQKVTPIEKVGVYVPGGKAVYPSTVLMDIIPAKVAGVKEVYMVTPAKNGWVNSVVLAAGYIAGADKIYKIGGAQSIGALAYGTESIPKVDKIVGPGNIFVALAKKMVFGVVDIDMIAGPSEITIVADETAIPAWVAADMLSQAEHDELASSVAITFSEKIAGEIESELSKQLGMLSRKDIAEVSIRDYSGIFIVDSRAEAAELCNMIAPEHLELCVNNPFEFMMNIKHAGAIFLGNYSPEPVGDYFAGPNHTLPTGGTARFSSPLGVYDFIKRSSIISYSKDAMHKYGKMVRDFAYSEGLEAHGISAEKRYIDK